jgi:hypothetical protein
LLGPTAFGRIPGFTEHIFPSQSIPYLSLVANIGLALFLFLVGLEIDAAVISRNARMSMTVAFAGIVIRKSEPLKSVIIIRLPKFAPTCSFWSGCRLIRAIVSPVRGSGRSVHAFHAFCWSRIFHHCVPRLVSHPYRTQTFGHDGRNRCLVCWSRKRYCGMDPFGFERRLGERGVWSHSLVDPPDLRRVDVVLAPCG